MTPFLQFRMWLRRGPSSERTAAGLASVVVLALAVWTLIPINREESSSDVETRASAFAGQAGPTETTLDAVPGEAAGEAGGPAAASAHHTSGPADGGAGDAAAAVPSGGPAAAGEAADPCAAALGATDQGVSPTEIFVAVPVVNLVGAVGNETFGVRGNVEEVAQAIAAGINAEGGVACRKLRIKVYKVNPLDQNEQRAKCLEIIGDKPFAVIDVGGYLSPVSRQCLLRAKLPTIGSQPVGAEEAQAAYPFLYSQLTSTDRATRNWVFEAAARRSFDPQNGFRKLGLLLDECNPKGNGELVQHLAKLGVSRDKTSAFTVSCAQLAPQNQISQAVLQHRNADVSHVFLAGNAPNGQSYVRQADSVRWKPTYLTSDYGAETTPTVAPDWPDGFDGAVAITSSRSGERNSGIEAPWVVRCNEWLKRANVQPSEDEKDQNPVSTCDQFRLFAAAANAAGPNLVRTTLVDGGLAKVGRFEAAFGGDSIYDRPGKVTGGDFIRAIQWHLNCRCWKIIDPKMKPGH